MQQVEQEIMDLLPMDLYGGKSIIHRMTKQQALEKLELQEGASQAEITAQYNEFYNEFQLRITNAPTEHQRKIYQKKLEELEEAYQTLSGKTVDASELPNIKPVLLTEDSPTSSYEQAEPFQNGPSERNESTSVEMKARALLSLEDDFSAKELEKAYHQKKEIFNKAINSSPSAKAKAIYVNELEELEAGYELLKSKTTLESPLSKKVKEDNTKKTNQKKFYKYLSLAGTGLICILSLVYFFAGSTEDEKKSSVDFNYERGMKAFEKGNWPEAISELKIAADSNNTDAFSVLAYLYFQDSWLGDEGKVFAKQFASRAIESGDKKGYYVLALLHDNPMGEDFDEQKVEAYTSMSLPAIKEAADSGNLFWLTQLGNIYYEEGPYQNGEKAFEIFQSLVDKDYSNGYVDLAYCYKEGIGVNTSYRKYESLLRTAVNEHNNIRAMFGLLDLMKNCDDKMDLWEQIYFSGYTRASYSATFALKEWDCKNELSPEAKIKWYIRAINDIESGEIDGISDQERYMLNNQIILLQRELPESSPYRDTVVAY